MNTTSQVQKHTGGCHCGAVRFEAELDVHGGPSRCNCSICTKISAVGSIVKPAAFKLVSGESELSAYAWGAKVSQRYFCKHCGVHCFGRGHLAEVGGDFVSINLNTLDDLDTSSLKLVHWDGRNNNWQAGPRDTPWPLKPEA